MQTIWCHDKLPTFRRVFVAIQFFFSLVPNSILSIFYKTYVQKRRNRSNTKNRSSLSKYSGCSAFPEVEKKERTIPLRFLPAHRLARNVSPWQLSSPEPTPVDWENTHSSPDLLRIHYIPPPAQYQITIPVSHAANKTKGKAYSMSRRNGIR